MENDDPSIVHRFPVAEFYSSSTSTFILCSMQHGYEYTYRYRVDTDTEIRHFLKNPIRGYVLVIFYKININAY